MNITSLGLRVNPLISLKLLKVVLLLSIVGLQYLVKNAVFLDHNYFVVRCSCVAVSTLFFGDWSV